MVDLFFDVRGFSELSNIELYDLLKLRNEVFIVEQNCAYLDLDDKDQKAKHVLVYHKNRLAAYARCFPEGISYTDAASIGRVIIKKEYRNNKWGYPIMEFCIKLCFRLSKEKKITISAQSHLSKFYGKCGFVTEGETYLEDNIPHIKMSLIKQDA